ncbi:hypothetical protein B566_EDAN006752 [Ephemera danica]|nr:hypothetical protein B566_EDAN006752 [Ephemera danica]
MSLFEPFDLHVSDVHVHEADAETPRGVPRRRCYPSRGPPSAASPLTLAPDEPHKAALQVESCHRCWDDKSLIMCFSVDGVIAPCAVSKCKDGTFNNFDLVTKQQFVETAIKTHVKSSAHIGATLDLSSFAKRTIHAGFDHQQRASTIQHNANVAKNRDILKRLIDVVLHLANQELAFRGHDESETSLNQGNYIEALKLLAKYDRELQEHLSQPPNAPFKASVLRQAQDNDIRNAEFLAVMLDESTDRDKSSQLSTVLRYCVNGEVRETFRGFTDVSRNRSANALCEHKKGLELNVCITRLNETREFLLANQNQGFDSSKTFQEKTVSEIYHLLSSDLKSTFTEVHKLCELILTLPSTTASVERSFSAMNRIMDYLRTTMGQERLSDLSLLSIEKSQLRKLMLQDNFYDLVLTEFLKKDRRIVLHYRT